LRRSRRLLCTSLAAAIAAATPRPSAHAEDDRVASYRAAVVRGQQQFAAGNYATARAEFRAAYDIHPEPVLLFNIASTYRREGERERALEQYREFVRVAPAEHPRRALAEATIGELEEELAQAAASAPAPELVPEQEAPEPPGLPEVVLELEEEIEAPARPRNRLLWPSLALGGGGAIAAGLAVYSARSASGAEARLEALGSGDEWGHEQQGLYEDGVAARRRVLLFSGAAAALVTTGVVLYVVGERRKGRETATLTVAPEGDGGVVTLGRRW